MRKLMFVFVILLSFSAFSWAQGKVHVNQIGFGANAQKLAVYVGASPGVITIKSLDGMVEQVLTLGEERSWSHSFSGEKNRILDFTDIERAGHYAIFENGNQISPAFQIGVSYDELLQASMKFFYLQRSGTAIENQYAPGFARTAGHRRGALIYDNAGTSTGQSINTEESYRGWYDAGDYGRYVVNSGISTYTLLALYEKYANKMPNLNIPSEPGLSDLLAEIKWNLDWMLSMQAADGGVYHKMTTMSFPGDIAPANDGGQLVVMGKTTAATLNFAAVMAVASRVYNSIEYLNVAKRAWDWARANPNHYYYRSDVTQNFPASATRVTDPTSTGDYGDLDVTDEFFFAAAALLTVDVDISRQQAYFDIIEATKVNEWNDFYVGAAGWNSVGSLGTLEITRNKNSFSDIIYNRAVSDLIGNSGYFIDDLTNSYGLPFDNIFYWGSNSSAANTAIQLLEAYDLTKEDKYKNSAQAILDYILGRNPLGQSYVTGFGSKSPVNTHSRLAVSYGKVIPGQLAGGPSLNGCTGADNYSNAGATRYQDNYNCYGYNEITINWNAPLAYLVAALSEQGEEIEKFEAVTVIDDFANSNNSGAARTGEYWFAFPMGNATYSNQDALAPINYIANQAELLGITASMSDPGWGDFAGVSLGLQASNNGIEYNLSQCTDGFSYEYQGASHRFTFELENGINAAGEPIFATFYGNTGRNDGQLLASTSWTTVEFTSFTRDIYDGNAYDEALNWSRPGQFRWTVRPFGNPWSITNGSLLIKNFKCLGMMALPVVTPPEPGDLEGAVVAFRDAVHMWKLGDAPVEPVFSVTFDGGTLTEGTDYTVEFENNDTIGLAAIILTGKEGGEFAGTTKRVTFYIIPWKGWVAIDDFEDGDNFANTGERWGSFSMGNATYSNEGNLINQTEKHAELIGMTASMNNWQAPFSGVALELPTQNNGDTYDLSQCESFSYEYKSNVGHRFSLMVGTTEYNGYTGTPNYDFSEITASSSWKEVTFANGKFAQGDNIERAVDLSTVTAMRWTVRPLGQMPWTILNSDLQIRNFKCSGNLDLSNTPKTEEDRCIAAGNIWDIDECKYAPCLDDNDEPLYCNWNTGCYPMDTRTSCDAVKAACISGGSVYIKVPEDGIGTGMCAGGEWTGLGKTPYSGKLWGAEVTGYPARANTFANDAGYWWSQTNNGTVEVKMDGNWENFASLNEAKPLANVDADGMQLKFSTEPSLASDNPSQATVAFDFRVNGTTENISGTSGYCISYASDGPVNLMLGWDESEFEEPHRYNIPYFTLPAQPNGGEPRILTWGQFAQDPGWGIVADAVTKATQGAKSLKLEVKNTDLAAGKEVNFILTELGWDGSCNTPAPEIPFEPELCLNDQETQYYCRWGNGCYEIATEPVFATCGAAVNNCAQYGSLYINVPETGIGSNGKCEGGTWTGTGKGYFEGKLWGASVSDYQHLRVQVPNAEEGWWWSYSNNANVQIKVDGEWENFVDVPLVNEDNGQPRINDNGMYLKFTRWTQEWSTAFAAFHLDPNGLNIAGTDGLCLSYSSDGPITLILESTDNENSVRHELPKAENGKISILNWSNAEANKDWATVNAIKSVTTLKLSKENTGTTNFILSELGWGESCDTEAPSITAICNAGEAYVAGECKAVYAVTFDFGDDATALKELEVIDGNTVAAQSVEGIVKAGYLNDGKWYMENSAFNFATAITGNITLSLKWIAAEVEITDAVLAAGVYDVEYDAAIEAETASGTIAYALKAGSELPAGLTLSEEGVISGTPTAAGTFTFTVVAKNIDNLLEAEAEFTIAIAKATQTAPDIASVDAEIAETSITLFAEAGIEIWNAETEKWVEELESTGLNPGTLYEFLIRKAETATHLASSPINASFTTLFTIEFCAAEGKVWDVSLESIEKCRDKYVVSFNLNGGSGDVPSIALELEEDGTAIVKPVVESYKTGYTNDGEWYTDSSGLTVFNFGTTEVKSSIELFLKWVAAEVEITTAATLADGTFGTEYNAEIAFVNANGTVTFSTADESVLAAAGLSFSNGIISGIPTIVGSVEFTVVATNMETGKFAERLFFIAIGKATLTQEDAPEVVDVAQVVTARTITLNSIESGVEISNDEGKTWKDTLKLTSLEPYTEYAFWIRKVETATHFASPHAVISIKTLAEFVVTFNFNNSEENATETVEIGSKANPPQPGFKVGYTTDGKWCLDVADCADEEAFDFETSITGNITLNLKWIPITYTVTFNFNGDNSETIEAKETIGFASTIADAIAMAPGANGLSKTGFTTEGDWCVDAACTESFDFADVIIAAKTFYLKWTAAPVTISTDTQLIGGAVGEAYAAEISASSTAGGTITYTIALDEEGLFDNGLSLNSATGAISGLLPMVAGDYVFTIKAVNTASDAFADKKFSITVLPKYTVTFNFDDDSETKFEAKVVQGSTVVDTLSLEGITKTGYLNDGVWYIEEDVAFDFEMVIEGDLMLSLKWTSISELTATCEAEGKVWENNVCRTKTTAEIALEAERQACNLATHDWNPEGETAITRCSQKQEVSIGMSFATHGLGILRTGESFSIQGLTKAETVRIFDLKGKVLMNRTVMPNESVSISHLPKGMYLVNVNGKTFRMTK